MRKGGIVKTRQIKIEYKRQLALAKFPFAPRGRWRDSTPSTVNTQYTRNTTQDSQKRESKGVLNKYFLVSDHTERRNHHTSGQTDWPVTRVPSVAQVARVSLKKKKKIRSHLAWPVLGIIHQMCVSVPPSVKKKMLHMHLALAYSTTSPNSFSLPTAGWMTQKRHIWSFWANECASFLMPVTSMALAVWQLFCTFHNTPIHCYNFSFEPIGEKSDTIGVNHRVLGGIIRKHMTYYNSFRNGIFVSKPFPFPWRCHQLAFW